MTALKFRTGLALAGGAVPLDAERADIAAESGFVPMRAAAERKADNLSRRWCAPLWVRLEVRPVRLALRLVLRHCVRLVLRLEVRSVWTELPLVVRPVRPVLGWCSARRAAGAAAGGAASAPVLRRVLRRGCGRCCGLGAGGGSVAGAMGGAR
jgi:hypothetical protein